MSQYEFNFMFFMVNIRVGTPQPLSPFNMGNLENLKETVKRGIENSGLIIEVEADLQFLLGTRSC